MYLNNDDQQWWYFLVSAIALLRTIGSILLAVCHRFYLIADCRWLWYCLGWPSAEAIPAIPAFSVYGSSFLEFWYFWSMNDDCWQQLYRLRWAIAESCTIGSPILALWSWYYSDHDNRQQQ